MTSPAPSSLQVPTVSSAPIQVPTVSSAPLQVPTVSSAPLQALAPKQTVCPLVATICPEGTYNCGPCAASCCPDARIVNGGTVTILGQCFNKLGLADFSEATYLGFLQISTFVSSISSIVLCLIFFMASNRKLGSLTLILTFVLGLGVLYYRFTLDRRFNNKKC
jgi:hypothetical protein